VLAAAGRDAGCNLHHRPGAGEEWAMSVSNIEWTEETWNPVGGCFKVSAGCKSCYAETMAKRLRAMAIARGDLKSPYLRVIDERGRWTGIFETFADRLAEPLGWKKPRKVFVNSMSDLFGEGVPFEFIAAVFGVMAATPHTYQVLTKRPARMLEFFAWLESQAKERAGHGDPRAWVLVDAATDAGAPDARWTAHPPLRWTWPLPNVWLGVSVEDQAAADERIPLLLQAPAAVRFLSCEPLLGPVDLGLCAVTCSCCKLHRGQGRWVRLARQVRPDFPSLPGSGGPAPAGLYRAHSNPHGALSVRRGDGSLLGIKPGEFEFLPQVDWVIGGGESNGRPLQVDWLRSLREQCATAGVTYFPKQLGSHVLERADRGSEWPDGTIFEQGGHDGALVRVRLKDRKGGNPSEWPTDLRVRRFPEVRDAG
jgi:protein gp37